MSAREFKPGDVAMVTAMNRDRFRATFDGEVWREHGDPTNWKGAFLIESVDIRPLVVIDPESLEDQEALAKALVEAMYHAGDKRSAAVGVMPATVGRALNALVDPKPRIEEPTGLGAVVEDDDGRCWARVLGASETPWGEVGDLRWRRYAEITVVRVLSEGVHP